MNLLYKLRYFYSTSTLNVFSHIWINLERKNLMNFKLVLLTPVAVGGGMSSSIIRGWYRCNAIVGNCGCALRNTWNMSHYKDRMITSPFNDTQCLHAYTIITDILPNVFCQFFYTIADRLNQFVEYRDTIPSPLLRFPTRCNKKHFKMFYT